MEKNEFTKKFAERTGSTSAEAADRVDRVVNDLLRRLRAGKTASLPGFGPLLPEGDAKPRIQRRGRVKKAAQ
jgi:nucleoid DNA-binding protein